MRSSNGEIGTYPKLFVGQIITDRGSGQHIVFLFVFVVLNQHR